VLRLDPAYQHCKSILRALQCPAANILWAVLADQVAHLLLTFKQLQAATPILLLPADATNTAQLTHDKGMTLILWCKHAFKHVLLLLSRSVGQHVHSWCQEQVVLLLLWLKGPSSGVQIPTRPNVFDQVGQHVCNTVHCGRTLA
jgi:hypothetical protein